MCPFVLISGKYVKVQRKQALVSGSDSSNKHSPSNKRSLVASPVAHRPLRDRIIHLLALKPYRKPELLLWLERERASPKDKADLTSVLDEVRHLAHCGLMVKDATRRRKYKQSECFSLFLEDLNIYYSPTCLLMILMNRRLLHSYNTEL